MTTFDVVKEIVNPFHFTIQQWFIGYIIRFFATSVFDHVLQFAVKRSGLMPSRLAGMNSNFKPNNIDRACLASNSFIEVVFVYNILYVILKSVRYVHIYILFLHEIQLHTHTHTHTQSRTIHGRTRSRQHPGRERPPLWFGRSPLQSSSSIHALETDLSLDSQDSSQTVPSRARILGCCDRTSGRTVNRSGRVLGRVGSRVSRHRHASSRISLLFSVLFLLQHCESHAV